MPILPPELPRDVTPPSGASGLSLTCVGRFPNTRVLAWDGDLLYASRGYRLVRCRPAAALAIGTSIGWEIEWEKVARFSPVWWRNITSETRLSCRLMRDGFHALAVLPSKEVIAALPGVIATLPLGEKEFHVTHRLSRGTRPLNIAVAPDGRVFWGEYFDNPHRDAVHIYGSHDRGETWNIVYSFGKNSIRHIHNIVYDPWENCLWILTGDIGKECRILRASLDFTQMDPIIFGDQQARAVAAVAKEDGLYFASDTPLEQNHIYRLDRQRTVTALSPVHASVLCGCAVGDSVFFTSMVEPSPVNLDRTVAIYGSTDGSGWQKLHSWKKDGRSDKFFQYGNAFLPTGNNKTKLLAVTSIAVESHDLEASLWTVTTISPG